MHYGQVQGRVRRLRDLRASRGGQPDLPGPLRAAARGQESAGIAASDGEQVRVSRARWATSPTRSTKPRLAALPGTDGDRPRPLFDRRRKQARQRAADPDRLRARADRDLPQRQPRQRRRAARQLVRDGSIFQTSSDTEVVLHLYARSKAADAGRGDRRSRSRRCAARFRSSMLTQGPADRRRAIRTGSGRSRSAGSATR